MSGKHCTATGEHHMTRHFGIPPRKPTVFLSREEIEKIDMAAVREAAVISWLVLCATGLCAFLAVGFVVAGAVFSLE